MASIFKVILLCLVIPDSLKAELTLEILVFLPYNIPSLPTSLVLTRPAFDLAVESANEKYFPHLRISVKYLHNESLVTCDAVSSQSVEKIAEYYYRFRTAGTCYATVMSGTETFIHTSIIKPSWLHEITVCTFFQRVWIKSA